jgi:peptidoglycan/xylan/chitin deacetylase (PgdA/CDA1 family)
VFFTLPAYATNQQIALTFDDAPRPDTAYFNSSQRNQYLLKHLAKHKVTAMFFVTTKHMTDGREQRLDDYQQYGQLLGNHSHSHDSANRTSITEFLLDAEQAHKTLSQYSHYRPFFRFPYLHHGETQNKLEGLRTGIKKLGLQQGFVTVDNYDWYLDSLLQQATKTKLDLPLEKWRKVYIQHLIRSVSFSQQMAIKYLGRPVKQILLLHENDLAALFIGDLINTLQSQGWEFISPIEAFQDPLTQTLPNTLFNGQGRIAALAAEKGVAPKKLFQAGQDEEDLKQQLLDLGLVPQ